MPSSWGKIFRVSTYGESHGPSVGVVVDGVPAGLPFPEEEIQKDLTRRRPGQNDLTTPRDEKDRMVVESGVFQGKTTGSPILMKVNNENTIGSDYDEMTQIFRPSHADYTYTEKYGHRAHVGGGRSSVRETIGRVAAAGLARVILERELGISTVGWVDAIGPIDSNISELEYPISRDIVDRFPTRCPNQSANDQMETLIRKLRDEGDSVGGVVKIAVRNLPPGLGDPVYDKLDADLAKAILSISACKGFEVGSGFSGTRQTGSQHNDEFYIEEGTRKVKTRTNNSGGIQGGISNGMDLILRAAFKPTSTIKKEQKTVNNKNEETILKAKGRHDPCVLPRAVPIVEAVVNLVLVDAYLYQRALQPKWFMKYANLDSIPEQ
ncbi:chorismate synthase [Leptospira brenneri]|uniref:Chorismate synthase n=1 Tax=Leptospira brenneri TaxID=2023182 RepID=A0A2M9Y5V9_9LEPT|nr:chorismate synthase [Leptospira brenneri]PJZ46958.1 chorismate synthase [Leptospira brenneri]TGK96083.1 chorismate synthase [Leptospira brenneri]